MRYFLLISVLFVKSFIYAQTDSIPVNLDVDSLLSDIEIDTAVWNEILAEIEATPRMDTITIDSLNPIIRDTVYAGRLLKEAIELIDKKELDLAYLKADSARQMYILEIGYETKEVADCLHQMGRVKESISQLDDAEIYFIQAVKIRIWNNGFIHLDVANLFNNLGHIHHRNNKNSKAIEYCKNTLKIRLNKFGAEHQDVADCYYNLGAFYNAKRECDFAIENLEKGLRINLKVLGTEHPHLAVLYTNFGRSYDCKEDYNKAIENNNKALKILLKTIGVGHPNVSRLYFNLGVNYFHKREYFKARECYEKALVISVNKFGLEHPFVADCLNSLGLCYSSTGEVSKAKIHFEKALEIWLKALGPDHHWVAIAYNNIGTCSKNDSDISLENYEKALEICIKELGEEHPLVALPNENLGRYYENHGKNVKAGEYFEKALEIRLKALGTEHHDVVSSYIRLGVFNLKKMNNSSALGNYENAIAASKYKTYLFQDVNSFEYIIEALKGASETLIQIYLQSNDTSHLHKAISYIDQAIAAIKYESSQFTSESSQSHWQERNHKVYEQAIDLYLMKSATFNENVTSELFAFSENSKAGILQSQIKSNDALSFSGIPDSLLQKEYDLRIDISWREKQKQVLIEKGQAETDSAVLAVSSIVFDLKREQESLIQTFEQDYPEYYKLKYDLSTVSLGYVQDSLLSADQTLIEYFTGDSTIYIFTVTKDSFDVKTIQYDFNLDSLASEMNKSLYSYHSTSKDKQTDVLYNSCLDTYIQSSGKLYQTLIEPVKSLLKKEVIIVPDGILSTLPFEALLSAQPQNPARFDTYPYFINDHNISYAYSATLLDEMKNKKHKKEPTKSLIAFAPFYEGSYALLDSTMQVSFDSIDGRDTVIFNEVVMRNELKPLPASGAEVKTAGNIWKGTYYINSDATEERFLKEAGDYRIVHLSTHGVADARQGDYSYLAFAEIKDSIENEFLYVRDIYNTSLNADLVVLSACETAKGELQKGEGVISLARAFAYAGAKSLLTTLWVVDDETTKDLMRDFYLRLRQGAAKDVALREAKLRHIKKAKRMQKHPFFWAGFIGVGDMSALK